MQPLFTSLPLALIVLLLWQWLAQAAAISDLFPIAVYLLLLFTAILSGLMRQWHWIYSLTLLAFSVLMLVLQWQSKPQLLTVQGITALVLLAAALPAVWQLTPVLAPLQQNRAYYHQLRLRHPPTWRKQQRLA